MGTEANGLMDGGVSSCDLFSQQFSIMEERWLFICCAGLY